MTGWGKAVSGRSRWEDAGIQLAASLSPLYTREVRAESLYDSLGSGTWYAAVRIGHSCLAYGVSGRLSRAWRRCLADYLLRGGSALAPARASSPEELALALAVSAPGCGEGGS